MAPDKRPDGSDRHARKSDGHISKNLFSGKDRHHIRDDPHRRKDHDIGGGMGVNPEHVLIKNGIAPFGWVKNSYPKISLKKDEDHGDSNHRGGKYLDPRRRIDPPNKKRQTIPGHSRSPESVGRCHEVNAGQDGRHAQDKNAKNRKGNIDRGSKAIRRIERPSCIRRAFASENGDRHNRRSGDIKPPGEKVDPRKSYISRADLNREEEISEDRRDCGNDNQKDHRNAVQCKERIISLGLHDGAPRGNHLQPHEESENHP